ncbi:thiopeptide-type bacteriocin biosynthesis protein [Flavobacterium sp. KACC 22761]|uniref:lantibiotic dehydratase n=1 Tax=Flavobacterium sp. KACC 22761 TaxID=3092665 RepID=UPI002A758B45|nr:thiopeptide-type bacteriocin biosynthesis protein [Flavobacterium sp. KACC 22761]WPO79418.1 thiopeptide-type bacteriocin biosynthesis protein [Flavobacterium sp. KACC 22761]
MKFFNTIIKRTASFPIESYTENRNNIKAFFFNNDLFQLSILFASRSLYNDVKKNKSGKTNLSLNKYFSRAHFNPIPFGLFTSVGSSEWRDKTVLLKSKLLELKVEFDNLYISEKTNLINAEEWKQYRYFTNPSVHFLSPEKISFYKSQKLPIGSYETKYVELDYDEDIQWLLDRFKNGTSIKDVTNDLLENEFSLSEIDAFLLEIISAGLIINEVTFHPYRETIYKNSVPSTLINLSTYKLESKNDFDYFTTNYIAEQDIYLSEEGIQSSYSHSISLFEKESDYLDSKIQEKLFKYIQFNVNYNSDYTPITNSVLEFGNKFYHSFSDGYIPLSKVFNPYSGLKYSTTEFKNENKLHSDILSQILTASSKEVLLKNVKTSIKSKNQLPATFNVIFEILNCKITGKEIVYCKSVTGTSAINLLSRFNHISEAACQDIANFEKEIYKDKIIAEINMIAKPRATNIISSHQYYDYNIPINTAHSENSNPIYLADLYLRFNGSGFVLVSKKHQKEIIPRVTSAINNGLSDSEAHRFLADLQSQNNEIHHINFNLNYYKNFYLPYVPRIYLDDDLLLYPAQLLVANNNYTFEQFKKVLFENVEKNDFSKRVSLTDKKGEIIIDIENDEHLEILFSRFSTSNTFYISESLYESFFPAISSNEKHHAHEFVASIKNTEFTSVKNTFKIPEEDNFETVNVPVLSNWLYLDLTCNPYAQNDLLTIIYDAILSEETVDQFFYVRYNYPENHLRVRFKTESKKLKEHIISEINNLKTKNFILTYKILPYEPETYRYGGKELLNVTESIFSKDSFDTIQNILKTEPNDEKIICFSVLKIQYYFSLFGFTLDQMIMLCDANIESFSNEFTLSATLRKELNQKFSVVKNKFDDIIYANFLNDESLKSTLKSHLEKSDLIRSNYAADLIHMSLNRLFDKEQRYNEFKSYYWAKLYFNRLKFTKNAN